MRFKRNYFEIFIEILENCSSQIASTRLMSTVGVHVNLFKKYACFLEELGFIKRVKPTRVKFNPDGRGKPAKFRYQIAPKGVEVLQLVKEAPLLSELFSYRQWLEKREAGLDEG